MFLSMIRREGLGYFLNGCCKKRVFGRADGPGVRQLARLGIHWLPWEELYGPTTNNRATNIFEVVTMGSTALRVLIADSNREFCAFLQQRIDQEPDLICVGTVHDGRSALLQIGQLSPDVVILDLVLPHLDGLGVLERAKQAGMSSKFLILTAFGTDDFLERALRLGADCFLMKPVESTVLVKRIRETAGGPKEKVSDRPGDLLVDEVDSIIVERMVAQRITEIGVPAHYKGYRYLKDAIAMVIHDVELLGQVTKVLYPAVAKNHKSSPEKVERAMRHAIETAWSRGDVDVLHRAFGYSVDANRGRPSNSSFVAKIADEIRLELKARRDLQPRI